MHAKSFDGKRLKQIRLRRGLTQDALARAIPTTHRNIVRWEMNHHQPQARMIAGLAHALEVDEGDFFTNGSEDEEDESELAQQLLTALRGLIRAERERVA